MPPIVVAVRFSGFVASLFYGALAIKDASKLYLGVPLDDLNHWQAVVSTVCSAMICLLGLRAWLSTYKIYVRNVNDIKLRSVLTYKIITRIDSQQELVVAINWSRIFGIFALAAIMTLLSPPF